MSHISNLGQYQYQQGINIAISNNKNNIQSESSTTSNVNSNNILRAGDIIQGEIMETDGSQVKLMLGEGMILNARLEQEIQMLLGQKMIFAVRTGDSGQISLSPLFENMAKQETGNAALKEAGMPINDNNLKLVSMLMQEGMSIDKNTLNQFVKLTGSYPDVPLEQLVQMNKLGITINEPNITQYQQYEQNNHQLMQSVADVVEQIPESYTQLVQQGDVEGAKQMLLQVLELFVDDSNKVELPESNRVNIEEQEVLPTKENANVSETLEQQNSIPTENDKHIDNKSEKIYSSSAEPVTVEEQSKVDVYHKTDDVSGKDMQKTDVMVTKQTTDNIDIKKEVPLTKTEMKELLHSIKQLGVDEDTLKQIEDKKMDTADILRTVKQQLQTDLPQGDKSIRQLLHSTAFKKVLQEAISKQWQLRPDDLREENGVTKFYERLEKQTRQLVNNLEQSHLEQTPLAKTVQNMHSNINFMNDLNHMFTYVQLPLKLSDSNANGELYVYTNKKSLAAHSGDISALLHLDMEHIGLLDIYVVLHNGEKVTTNFKVQDEEILDLLGQHMDELTRRLNEKGYQMSSTIQISEVDKPVMQEILQDNKKNVPLAMYTFDARA